MTAKMTATIEVIVEPPDEKGFWEVTVVGSSRMLGPISAKGRHVDRALAFALRDMADMLIKVSRAEEEYVRNR